MLDMMVDGDSNMVMEGMLGFGVDKATGKHTSAPPTPNVTIDLEGSFQFVTPTAWESHKH